METTADLGTLVSDAYAAGQSYEEVKGLVQAAGWRITDEDLASLWQALEATDPTVAPVQNNTSALDGEVPAEVERMSWSWGGLPADLALGLLEQR
jgi:hypothetical protein